MPGGGWQRLSCAGGSKGPRLYDRALIGTKSPQHHLLARRSLQPGGTGVLELAFYRCWSPRPVTLAERAAVAGALGGGDCFAEATNEAGLDHYQVRKYRAWYRHTTLSMLAHAFLAVTARDARQLAPPPPPRLAGPDMRWRLKGGPDPCGQAVRPAQDIRPPAFIPDGNGRDLIPLTAAESRRLFNLHVPVTRPDTFRKRWSGWRRYRQAAARKSRYTRRLKELPDPGSPRARPACPTSSPLPPSGHGGRERRGTK